MKWGIGIYNIYTNFNKAFGSVDVHLLVLSWRYVKLTVVFVTCYPCSLRYKPSRYSSPSFLTVLYSSQRISISLFPMKYFLMVEFIIFLRLWLLMFEMLNVLLWVLWLMCEDVLFQLCIFSDKAFRLHSFIAEFKKEYN